MSSTAELAHLHTNFEQTLLSVGGEILPRWRLLHQQDDEVSQPMIEKVDENKSETLGQGDKSMTEGENEKMESSLTSEVATAASLETDLSRQSSGSCSGEVASSSSSTPLPHKPKLHSDLCYNVPSEVSRWDKQTIILHIYVCMINSGTICS